MKLTIKKETDKTKTKKNVKENKTKKDDDIPSFAKSPKGFIIELVKIVLIALVVIIPIRYFLFQPFYVRGASMEPNFYDNEYLIVDEITYRFTDPERGDVIVVKVPEKKSDFLIKRIIGMPGETIEIKDGEIIIFNDKNPNGFVLTENYLKEGLTTLGYKKEVIGEEEYYIMGDNRHVSLDSRSFGPLEGDNIVGRAWLRVWPFDQFSHFTTPEYNLITN